MVFKCKVVAKKQRKSSTARSKTAPKARKKLTDISRIMHMPMDVLFEVGSHRYKFVWITILTRNIADIQMRRAAGLDTPVAYKQNAAQDSYVKANHFDLEISSSYERLP